MAPQAIHFITNKQARWDDTFLQCVRLIGELQSMDIPDEVLKHLERETDLSKDDLEELLLRGQSTYDEVKFCLALENAMSGCCGAPHHQYVDEKGNVWSLQEEHGIHLPHHHQGRLKDLPDESYVFCVGCGKKHNISLGPVTRQPTEGTSKKKKEYPKSETVVGGLYKATVTYSVLSDEPFPESCPFHLNTTDANEEEYSTEALDFQSSIQEIERLWDDHSYWGLDKIRIKLHPEHLEYLSKLLNEEGLWRQEYNEGDIVWQHFVYIPGEVGAEVGVIIRIQEGRCSLFFSHRHMTGTGIPDDEELIDPKFFLDECLYEYEGFKISIC